MPLDRGVCVTYIGRRMIVLRAMLFVVLTLIASVPPAQAEWRVPLDFSNWSKPQAACQPFAFADAMETRSIGAWDALDIVPTEPPVRVDLTYAELERLGGVRMTLQVDAQALRKEMLEQARDDIRRAVRTTRIGSPAAAVLRGDTIEFQPRDGIDASAVSNAFAPLTSGSYPLLLERAVDSERAARGVRVFALRDEVFQERLSSSRQASMEVMERRIREVGIGTGLVQGLDDGRILVVIPGLKEPERLFHLLQSRAHLAFRMLDRSGDPCAAVSVLENSEVLRVHPAKTSLLVQRRVLISGEDVDAAAVVRQGGAANLAVAFRFNLNGAGRLARALQENPALSIAAVLDNEVIAVLAFREPVASGAVLISGAFDLQQAKELALLLRVGRLPAPLTVLDREIVEAKPR
jgi:protein-export membrane protein SecD